ncbi:hypothetical protein FKW77_007816 [Venturia effusa]|uniref:DRBM domain-containing protein n=1 Tax=Venturia effusa TaxID=50376 RepID=A0A517L5W6_9PEZI|nr:hypothetical protein FKW77_007816 [Venturia effusa]
MFSQPNLFPANTISAAIPANAVQPPEDSRPRLLDGPLLAGMAEVPANFDGLKLLDTATEMAKWNDEAHAIGLKVLEEREKEEQAKQEEKARLKRPMHPLSFAPVPAAKAVVAENVSKLYLLTQKRNINPVFDFLQKEVQSFGATLTIGDRVFTAEGPFSSKKEAKEMVARLGVEYLTENPDLGNLLPKTDGVVPSGGQGAVAELNLRCQKLRMAVPEYIIPEKVQGQFSAKLVLGGVSFEEDGPFPNKKLAKEAVAKLGLTHLENASTPASGDTTSVELDRKLHSIVDRHRLDAPKFEITEISVEPLQYRIHLHLDGELIQNPGPFATKQDAKRAVTIQGITFLEEKYKENGENWVELLNIFSQSNMKQMPTYEDFQETTTKQNLWASEVTIPLHASPFGRRDVPFGSKKQARQNAAREAVLWLRKNDYIPEDGPPKKKQKTTQQQQQNALSNTNITSSPLDSTHQQKEISYAQQVNGNPPIPPPSHPPIKTAQHTYHPHTPHPNKKKKPTDICLRQNIHVPTYELTPSATGPFYAGHALFTRSPVIANGRPIGHVENIFGKKNAKEAVARNVVRR